MNAQQQQPPNQYYVHLSLLVSNGQYGLRPNPGGVTLLVPRDPRMDQFLRNLSGEYTRQYGRLNGRNDQFIFLDVLDQYTVWWRPRGNHVNRNGVRQGDFFVWGHPSGRHFRSARTFAVHIFQTYIMVNPACPCGVC